MIIIKEIEPFIDVENFRYFFGTPVTLRFGNIWIYRKLNPINVCA